MKSNFLSVKELLLTAEGQRMYEKEMLPDDHDHLMEVHDSFINANKVVSISENLMHKGFVQVFLDQGTELTIEGTVNDLKNRIDIFIQQQQITVHNG